MRRRVEKGSFGGQLDDLVKVFPPKGQKGEETVDRSGDGRHINDRLFESAWRKARDEDRLNPGR